jgi:hypothetical protein
MAWHRGGGAWRGGGIISHAHNMARRAAEAAAPISSINGENEMKHRRIL